MKNFNRRAFLACGLMGAQAMLTGCGGGGGGETAFGGTDLGTQPTTPTTPTAPSPPLPEWTVGIPMAFAAGTAATIDLSRTLPASIAKGGTFGVDPSGAKLPSGVTLSASGVLSVAANAAVTVTTGVIFSYSEP